MITENTYLNANMAIQPLLANGIKLDTKDGTVLQELVELSTSLTGSESTTVLPAILANRPAGSTHYQTLEVRAGEVAAITGGFGGDAQHSRKQMAMVEDLGPSITAHISFARNVVAPMVIELGTKLQNFRDHQAPLSPISFFDVQACEIPAILKDEAFVAGDLLSYQDVQLQDHEWVSFSFPALQNQSCLDFINLGSDRLNELLGKWAMSLPEGYLDNVHKATFEKGDVKDNWQYELYLLSGQNSNPYTILNLSLATYLIAKKYMVQPAAIPDMTNARYKEVVRQIIDYAATRLWGAIKTIARQTNSGVMVVEANVREKRVVVHKDLYATWLAEGNCPEILLGMLTSGKVQYSMRTIAENKAELLRDWEQYVSLAQADIKIELRQRFMQFAEAEAVLGLQELSELEQEYLNDNPNHRTVAAKRIKEQVEYLGHRIMDDPMHTALHLVAKGRFAFTSAYDILQGMEQAAKDNPEIDPREAALLSAIDYIGHYLADQLKITK